MCLVVEYWILNKLDELACVWIPLGVYPEPIPFYEMVLHPEKDYTIGREITRISDIEPRFTIPLRQLMQTK
jgi:hypothetical protein